MILGEPHVQHLVRFVEHEDTHRVESRAFCGGYDQRAAGRGDDDVGAALERADLLRHRCAAVQGDDAEAGAARVFV